MADTDWQKIAADLADALRIYNTVLSTERVGDAADREFGEEVMNDWALKAYEAFMNYKESLPKRSEG